MASGGIAVFESQHGYKRTMRILTECLYMENGYLLGGKEKGIGQGVKNRYRRMSLKIAGLWVENFDKIMRFLAFPLG